MVEPCRSLFGHGIVAGFNSACVLWYAFQTRVIRGSVSERPKLLNMKPNPLMKAIYNFINHWQPRVLGCAIRLYCKLL